MVETLDFSGLSDDQLLNLIRAALREVSSRDPSLSAAARSAMLDEAERARIMADAGEREAAKLRALERERVAREAAAQVREANAARTQQTTQAAAAAAAEAARAAQVASEARGKDLLRRAAELVGKKPDGISVLLLDTQYGRRVLINEGGAANYTREHLSDWTLGSGAIKTVRGLVKNKAALAAYSAEIAARYTGRTLKIFGDNYDWTGNAT
jgi:hypothetical protein